MKLLVLSDIHANLCALEAVAAHEFDADRILCAGDVADFGPFPGEVIDWLVAHDVTCVSGNHDRAVLSCYRKAAASPAERDPPPYRWKHHNAECLEARHAAFLASCPETFTLEADGCTYLMTHSYGNSYDIVECLHDFNVFFDARVSTPGASERRIIFGHTHRQGIHYLDSDRLWLNPGSLSYRRPGDPGREAEYMTISDGAIAMKRLAYDRRPLLAAAQHIPLTEPQRDWAQTQWS